MFHNADAAGLGVFQAAQARQVLAFGANKNQNDVAPDVILSSAVIDIPRAFLEIAKQVKDGRFEAKVERMGMKEGVVSLVLNPRLEGRIPPALEERVTQTQAGIVAGSVRVPSVEF